MNNNLDFTNAVLVVFVPILIYESLALFLALDDIFLFPLLSEDDVSSTAETIP